MYTEIILLLFVCSIALYSFLEFDYDKNGDDESLFEHAKRRTSQFYKYIRNMLK
jgi:hypothetical protein